MKNRLRLIIGPALMPIIVIAGCYLFKITNPGNIFLAAIAFICFFGSISLIFLSFKKRQAREQ